MKLSQATIIILLVANLMATVWFGVNGKPISKQTQFVEAVEDEFPSVLTAEMREALFKQLTNAFNGSDYEALYDILGSSAKAQISKESALKEFEKLIKYFHSIESGSYTHSELIRTKGDTSIYLMCYDVKLSEKSEFGRSATLKISLAVKGNEYQVYGFRINAG